MTLISSPINFHSSFIMENQLADDYETSFLYEWQTAEEDLEFLDYTYCFEVERPNKRYLPLTGSASKHTTEILLQDNSDAHDEKQTIINLSMNKLRCIEDPESCLRRSVLINNTLKCIRSGLKTNNEDSAASCHFAYPSPCKRLRLNDTTSNSVATDPFKDSSQNHQGPFIGRGDNNDKEISNKQIDKLLTTDISLCTSEVSNLLLPRQNTEEAKRNCDTIRFAELEFPNVICALET